MDGQSRFQWSLPVIPCQAIRKDIPVFLPGQDQDFHTMHMTGILGIPLVPHELHMHDFNSCETHSSGDTH